MSKIQGKDIMTSKSLFISEVLSELRKAQTEKWKPPPVGQVNLVSLPPVLAIDDGRSLTATDALAIIYVTKRVDVGG